MTEYTPSKFPRAEPLPMEAFFRIKSKKKEILLSSSYNPSQENIKTLLETLSRNLALYFSSYDNVIALDQLTVAVEEANMSDFCVKIF